MSHTHTLTEEARYMREIQSGNLPWELYDTARELEDEWPLMTPDERKEATDVMKEALAIIYNTIGDRL